MALVTPSIKVSSVFGCRRGESPAQIVSNPHPRSLKTVSILKSYEKSSGAVQTRLRVRVYSSIKDCEVRVSDRDQNMRLIGQFSAPVKQEPSSSSPKSKQSKEEEEKQKYYVNMGYAIRTLREEFPELFYRELSFDVYRDDIVFKDPFITFIGIENYKSIFWALRFYGKIFFKALWVDIISVWQPVESVIMVRWVVHGIPRVPWESRGRFDGTSEYKLDKKGKIFEHRVDNIALNQPPKFRVLGVEELIQNLGCPSTPKPTYFEFSSSPVMKFVQLLGRLTSARHYLDGTLAIGRRHDSKTLRS